MRPLIIISDAAAFDDDAAAIAILLGDCQADIRLIVATSGNVWAEEAADNVRSLLRQLRRDDVDVCVGEPSAAFQLRRSAADQSRLAGSLRYIGAFAREIPNRLSRVRECGGLFEFMVIADRPDLLVIGPASPLAPIVRAHPNLANHVGRVYVMGGAIACEGNATPTAEFNFWFDPDAAEALMASGLPITLLPLDVVRGMHYSADFAAALRSDHPLVEYVHGSVAKPGTLTVCDEVLAAIAMDPQLVSRYKALKLSVETTPGSRYGAVSIVAETADRRSVEVIEGINTAEFWRVTREALLST